MSSKEQNRDEKAGRGRGRRGGRRTANQNSGRPLQRAERMMILDIWYQIDQRSREELAARLFGEVGASLPTGPPTPGGNHPPTPKSPGAKQQNHRTRLWEREILKDIPLIKEWGAKSPAERSQDKTATSVASILTGVVARGRARGASDQQIVDAINGNINDPQSLRDLFPRTEVRGNAALDEQEEEGKMEVEISQLAIEPPKVAEEKNSSPVAGIPAAAGIPAGNLALVRRAGNVSTPDGGGIPQKRWGDDTSEEEKSETKGSPVDSNPSDRASKSDKKKKKKRKRDSNSS